MKFSEGIDQLLRQTPEHVKGVVEVNQVYAHYQHEGLDFHHPDGGEAHYLKTPLFAKAKDFFSGLAHGLISEYGVNVVDGMQDQMEHLSREVFLRAPFEFGDLKASGHPYTVADGHIVKDRPPLAPRLEPTDLQIKSHLRYLFDPHRYAR